MINYVDGDILYSKADAIAHGVAPNDHFNQGLAMSLKEKWPDLYKDFRHYSHTHHPKEGTIWSWNGDSKLVVTMMTQEHAPSQNSLPGKSKSSYVNHCLRELKKEMTKKKMNSLALPKVATGVGGLEWDEVKALIENNFKDSEFNIYVYEKYTKDKEANEA